MQYNMCRVVGGNAENLVISFLTPNNRPDNTCDSIMSVFFPALHRPDELDVVFLYIVVDTDQCWMVQHPATPPVRELYVRK